MNIDELTALLREHNIPIARWGLGLKKTLGDLLQEISDGETTVRYENCVLTRCLSIVGINVFHNDSDRGELKLVEKMQILASGRSLIRNLDTSLGEKMRSGENPCECVRRAILEELGLIGLILFHQDTVYSMKSSDSYPGLRTMYEKHLFYCNVPHNLFHLDGYMETKLDGRRILFEWIPLAT